MGYPSEIPNSMPVRHGLPRRGRFARVADRLARPFARLFARLFARRLRTRTDAPDSFGQGIDPRRPPLTHEDARSLDFAEIERRLGD